VELYKGFVWRIIKILLKGIHLEGQWTWTRTMVALGKLAAAHSMLAFSFFEFFPTAIWTSSSSIFLSLLPTCTIRNQAKILLCFCNLLQWSTHGQNSRIGESEAVTFFVSPHFTTTLW